MKTKREISLIFKVSKPHVISHTIFLLIFVLMEKAFSSFLLIVLPLLHNVMASSAMTQTNITTDQLALLSLKSQIVLDPSHLLDESWSSATSVCHWVGVTCGSRHQRVKSLNLSNVTLIGRIPREFGNLSFLVSLDLGSNNFHGNLPQEMTCLRRLEFLDLSLNNFRGAIPSWFGFLHQLQVINIRNNSFTGSIPSSFSNMSTPETLDLNFNSIEGQIPKVIGSLINLRELRLRGNKIISSIPLSLSNASRLETLDLSYNSLHGNIPEGIGNLHNMNSLVIQYNQLMGFISFKIFNISRIEVIAFTGNSLSGSLPNGLCNGLPILKGLYLSINKLYLSDNKLHGNMPTSLSNCSQLQILSLSENEFDGPIHSEIGRLSNLQILALGTNHFTGIIHKKLESSWQNNLIGEIPKEISNLVELELLDLGLNSFSGLLDMESFIISRLRVVSLIFNNLSGSLPPNMCSILPNIEELYLGNLTNLVGTIPHSINCSKLTRLELAGNKLIYVSHLGDIYLDQNHLSGSLPNCLRNITSLRRIHLDSNKLSSNIPPSLGNLQYLVVLDLSSHYMVGSLPPEIGNLKAVTKMDLSMNQFSNEISLRHNKLQGSMPDSMSKMSEIPKEISNLIELEVLDLADNSFSGSLPMEIFNISRLRRFNLSINKLTGFFGDYICKFQHLVVLDLSSNNMVGFLPPRIGNLKSATKMDLSMNQFSNGIPREIGELQNLAHLSLRHNKLQGAIPDSMSNMVGLEFLDLSHNNISGIIPKSLEKLQNLKKGKRVPQQADSLAAITRERISYYELLQATNALSESNLIGSGSFGSVYKGVLRSGTAMAVKVFNLQLDVAFKSFHTECEFLRSLRHRNLVKVITSCSNLDFKAIVLEYMPNGSLEKYLYSHNYFLDIRQRLTIMIDVACALEYLHHGCSSAVIHCDLKPSNVLLDEDMVSHLSDFGISKLLGVGESDLYTKTLATFGYIAPEYGLEGLVSTKCDVYSYGVMLLETFTRRKPNEFEGDLSLKQWVSYSLPDAVMDVVETNLLTPTGIRFQKELDLVASIMKVALDCCAESPARRTNMKDVVGMLQKINIQLLAC
ncbi:hypothetical protein P3L10_014411 [Capsicum annuum]